MQLERMTPAHRREADEEVQMGALLREADTTPVSGV
jgi:hypothetical protein